MRTTLTLDSDVAQRLLQEMKRRGKPLKVVVNESLRSGLSQRPEAKSLRPYRVQPLHSRLKPGIDPDKLNQLVDELEIEASLEKRRR